MRINMHRQGNRNQMDTARIVYRGVVLIRHSL